MNKAYKIIWNKARECYVVVAEFAKTRSKSSSRSLSLLMTTGVLLSLLTSSAFASGTATVTGTSGTDDLVTIQGGTDISVTQNNGVITIGAVYDPTLETLRKYIKFNADYDSGTSLPSVAANSANSFVWGKNAAVSVYSLAEKSEKNIAIGAGSKIFAGNMGNPSKGTGSNTAIGADSSVGSSNNIYGTYDTVVGAGAKAYGGSNVVVGNSQAGLNQQIGTKSDGTKIWANVDNAVVVGSGAAAYSDKATAVGGAAIAGKKPTRTDYTDRSQAENAKITYTTAVGYGAHAFGMNSTAVGAQTVATGQQNISLGSGSEARKDNTMSVGFHAIGGAADATAIGHDAVVFGDGGLAIGHLVFTGMPALEGYRNNNLDESYIASPEGMKIAGDSKIYFRTEDGTVLKYEVKIGQNGEEDGKYYKVKAVQTGNSWKFVKVNAAGEEVSDTSPDAVQYLAKESMTKDTRTSSKVNHIDYFYIADQESSSKIYPTDEGVAIGTYVSTEGSRAMAIGMSSTAHDANNTALGLYSNTFGKDATAIGHASLSGARGLIETNVNTGEHTVSYQVTKKGISERTTIDGTVVSYDKNFAYEFSDGTNTLKVQNGKIVAVGGTAYTQTGIKLASDNTAVYRDTETGYLYYTKSGAKHLVKPDEDVIINGSGDTLTVSAGKMMLSNGGLAIGSYTHAEGDKSVAFGNASGASGRNSVAIGKFANAYGEGSIAFGSDAVAGAEVTTNVDGHKVLAITNKTGQPVMEDRKHVSGAVAFGNYAHATANNSLAFGTDAEATAKNSVAIGSGSVSADSSVALGYGSVATEENVISVGHKQGDAKYGGGTYDTALNRKIVNVASGVNDTDAVNVKQLTEAVGDKANKDLDNITDAGHSVIKSDAKSVINVVGADKATVTKADVNGVDTYTVSVKADGAVADGNENIVNGGTVYNALQAQKNEMNTALDGKANIGLDNITDNGKTVVRSLAQEAVKVVNGTNTTVTEGADGNAKTYAVNVTTNGTVTSGDTGVVTGGTVYDAIQDIVTGDMTGKANISLDNVNDAGHAVIKTDAKSAINVVGNDDITVNKTDVSGVDTYNLSIVKNGTIASGNEGIVTGSTVFTETRPASDGNYIAVNKTAGENLTALDSQVKTNADAIATNATDISNLKDLSNITETGKTVVKNLAKGSVNVVGADKAVVTKSDVEGVDTYTVSVKADGVVAQGNENIVTGGTVYDAITTATDTMNDALNSKANVSLDNVTEAGHNVIKSDAKSAINVVGKDDVTVTKSDVEGVDTYTVSVVKNGTVTSGNEGIVTGDTVYNALQEQKTATDTALEGKANVALDNITDDGKTVVRNLAKESVKVINGTNTTVTEGTDGDAKTYAVNVVANGVIEVDNNGLVTGGTVYNETRVTSNGNYISTSNSVKDNLVALDNAIKGVSDVADATQNELDNKANKDASNVTDATAWGNAIGTGTVNSNDGKLVTGKTVATETRVANNGNYVLADNTAGQNIAELDRVLKETRDIAEVASSSGTDANAVHYDSADKSVVTLAGTDGTLLTNLKDGEISETSKDAVTGKQLHDTNTKVEQVTSRVDTLETTVGTMNDGNYISKDASVGENLSTLDNQIKSVSDGLDSVTTNIGELRTDLDGKLNTNMDNLTEDGRTAISDIAKESVKVEGSGLAKVTSAEQGNVKVYTVDVKADGKVASGDTGLVTGDTIYNETRPADGNYVKNGNTTAENLSAIDTQVKTNTDDISNINQTVNNMGSRINKLGTRINKVGAGAAALAALHPQDFDPGTKWDIAAGFGNYRDANAVAIGAFYRPNDDTMFSIGTNFGNGENMVNAGVSVRLGHASEYAGLSRAELVKKIESQDKTLEKQQAEIDELKAIVAKLASK